MKFFASGAPHLSACFFCPLALSTAAVMPSLYNPRHERFAQEFAAGKTATESYTLAGYTPNRFHGAGLSHKSHIKARVAEILAARVQKEAKGLERAIERTAITKERVLRELAKIGFANMADYMQVGPSGDPYLDFSKLSRDQAAALVEVTVEDFRDGRGEDARDVRRVKFKLADKKGALVDIGKELGMFITRSELGPPGAFAEFDDAQLREAIASAIHESGADASVVAAITGTQPANTNEGRDASDEDEAT